MKLMGFEPWTANHITIGNCYEINVFQKIEKKNLAPPACELGIRMGHMNLPYTLVPL